MNTIPGLTPNTNICDNDSEAIRIMSSSLNDIKIEAPDLGAFSIDSMAPNNVESIGNINL